MSLQSALSEYLKLPSDELKAALAALDPSHREKIQKALCSSSSSEDTDVKAYAAKLAEADINLHRYAETLSDVLKNWASAWEEDKDKMKAIMDGENPQGVGKLLNAAAKIFGCEVAEVLTTAQSGKVLATYAMEDKSYESPADFEALEEIWSIDFDDYSYCLMLLRNWVFDVLSLANNCPDSKQRSLIGSMADAASLKGDS